MEFFCHHQPNKHSSTGITVFSECNKIMIRCQNRFSTYYYYVFAEIFALNAYIEKLFEIWNTIPTRLRRHAEGFTIYHHSYTKLTTYRAGIVVPKILLHIALSGISLSLCHMFGPGNIDNDTYTCIQMYHQHILLIAGINQILK